MHKNKRCPFSEKENKIIIESVKSIGEDWETIASQLPNRTPKQCHDRYYNYLRDGLKKDPWTLHEDETILRLFNEIGPKWSKMMNQLPGRSGNDIKNRWHKHIVRDPSNFVGIQNLMPNNYNCQFYDVQYYPYAYNSQFCPQMIIPGTYPIIPMNFQMIPSNQIKESNNIESEDGRKTLKNKNKKVARLLRDKPYKTSIKEEIKKERNSLGENEIPITIFKNNNEKGKTLTGKIDPKSSDKKEESFSSINLPDMDIQEFFDNLNITNVDFFSLM